MTNKNTIIAFDLDGTLLDSADDLIDTLNILLKEMNINEMKKSDVNYLVGNGALAMIQKAFKINKIYNDNINWVLLKNKFLHIYKYNCLKKSKLFPYTKEVLEELKFKKYHIVLVSNKPKYFVKKILRFFELEKYFNAVSGGDTFEFKKPDPRHLYETIKLANIESYNCIFIGDSISDALCAKKSNSKLILLTHGYSDLNIKSMGADFVLDNLKEIPNLITNEKFYLTK
tara:strand:- start:306 stop:992 length:687 start_codon:yes stop_codon:yes gene_type:complete